MAEESNPSEGRPEEFLLSGLLEVVFPYLELKELVVCSGVNRMWKAMASDNDLWRRLCYSDFPAVKGSCAAKVMTPTTGAKDLYRRLHQRWSWLPVLSPKDVDILLDVSHNGSPIFSECLPYSTNKMLQCFPESISLGNFVGVHKPPLSHGNLLHAMQTDNFQIHLMNPLYDPLAVNIAAYAGSLSVSLLAIRKSDGKFFRLLEGQASIASRRPMDDFADESVVPLVVKETHKMGLIERLHVDVYLYTSLLATGGKPALNRLELMDYAFSITSGDEEGMDVYNASPFSKHGLYHLQRVAWV